jgi:hypothetical protein
VDITQLILDDHHEQRRLFAPALLKVGQGPGGDETPEAETKDAIHDHNEIRDAVTAVAEHTIGSDGWFEAVAGADEADSDHMAEEDAKGSRTSACTRRWRPVTSLLWRSRASRLRMSPACRPRTRPR